MREERKLDSTLKKFELVGIQPGKIIFEGKSYDFRKMSAKTADALVQKGCKYIKRKEKAIAAEKNM